MERSGMSQINEVVSVLKDCPRCGNEAAKDFEEHMIYCTGCPLAVVDDQMKFSLLLEIWNSLGDQIAH
jgi:hypothetical protein